MVQAVVHFFHQPVWRVSRFVFGHPKTAGYASDIGEIVFFQRNAQLLGEQAAGIQIAARQQNPEFLAPQRANRSVVRIESPTTKANWVRTRSPVWWPKVSLMRLK